MRQVSGCIHVFDVKRSTCASACMAVCRLDTTEIGIVVKTDSYTSDCVYITYCRNCNESACVYDLGLLKIVLMSITSAH